MAKQDKLVPDTSVIIEKLVSKEVGKGNLKPKQIIIHEAVVAELESQANKGREVGISGLEEIKSLRELSGKKKFSLEFKGKRPGEFEIKYAKSGEIDSLIRDLAAEEKATLYTADRVQAFVAESKGIDVMLHEFEDEDATGPIKIEQFFDDTTMSVHIKEDCFPRAKKGMPGGWEYVQAGKGKTPKLEVEEMAKEIVEKAHIRDDSFVEVDRKGSTIVQLGRYRIVITRPPFADGYEITAVRPVKRLSLKEYHLSEKLKERLAEQAEGILVSGAPGHGKTTFIQALAEYYLEQDKVIKTVEAPRDLVLPDEITQYSVSHGSSQEIHDILLLSRPDYTLFDEMRNTNDFKLFADLRLSGVGMVGVVHATATIDAVQRFLGRIELGVIPHVIDTVIFIKNGGVNRVYSLSMEVKVPSGMTEADLARPVVVIHDFETGKLEFEIYTYGEQTIVVPVQARTTSPLMELASREVMSQLSRQVDVIEVEMTSEGQATVYVPPGQKRKIIGKGGENIDRIEKKLGISIQVEEGFGKSKSTGDSLPFDAKIGKRNVTIDLELRNANKDVDVFVDGEFLLTATVSKKGQIKLTKNNKIGRILIDALNTEQAVEIRPSG